MGASKSSFEADCTTITLALVEEVSEEEYRLVSQIGFAIDNDGGENIYEWQTNRYDTFCQYNNTYKVQFKCNPNHNISYYSREITFNKTSKTDCDAGQYLFGVQCAPCPGKAQVLGVSLSMNPRVPVRAWR